MFVGARDEAGEYAIVGETSGKPCLKYDSRPDEDTNDPVGRFPSERSSSKYESLSMLNVIIVVEYKTSRSSRLEIGSEGPE